MERFRTNPYLAPIDIRVRPDILESGLRTAVKTMSGKDISYAIKVLRDAQANYRTIGVEEYAQLSASAGTSRDEHKSIMRMAEAVNNIRSSRNSAFDDMLQAQKMENQIHEMMGDAIARKIEQGVKEGKISEKPYETSAAGRHKKRMAKVPMLPFYNIGERDKKSVEEIMRRIKEGKYWKEENKGLKQEAKQAAGEIMNRIKGRK
jgi:DNA polymerase III delta prime subunit